MTDAKKTNTTPDPDPNMEAGIVVNGRLLRDRYCETCQPAIRGTNEHVPYHAASPRCESGGRDHCTCDTCF